MEKESSISNSKNDEPELGEDIYQKVYNNFSEYVMIERIEKDEFLKDNPMYVTKEEFSK